MSEYPEHEKLQAVQAESQAIGEFRLYFQGLRFAIGDILKRDQDCIGTNARIGDLLTTQQKDPLADAANLGLDSKAVESSVSRHDVFEQRMELRNI